MVPGIRNRKQRKRFVLGDCFSWGVVPNNDLAVLEGLKRVKKRGRKLPYGLDRKGAKLACCTLSPGPLLYGSRACAAVGERKRKTKADGQQEEAHGDGHCCQGECWAPQLHEIV